MHPICLRTGLGMGIFYLSLRRKTAGVSRGLCAFFEGPGWKVLAVWGSLEQLGWLLQATSVCEESFLKKKQLEDSEREQHDLWVASKIVDKNTKWPSLFFKPPKRWHRVHFTGGGKQIQCVLFGVIQHHFQSPLEKQLQKKDAGDLHLAVLRVHAADTSWTGQPLSGLNRRSFVHALIIWYLYILELLSRILCFIFGGAFFSKCMEIATSIPLLCYAPRGPSFTTDQLAKNEASG